MAIEDYAKKRTANAKSIKHVNKESKRSEKTCKEILAKLTPMQKNVSAELKLVYKQKIKEFNNLYDAWDNLAEQIETLQKGGGSRGGRASGGGGEAKIDAMDKAAKILVKQIEVKNQELVDYFNKHDVIGKALKKI